MFSSISLFASANAGELSVSGTAKATYNNKSCLVNAGKGLGITNELNFTATGELDNGYTWSYSMELDPNAVSASTTASTAADAENDDTKLTLSTPYGTVGMFISEGGLDAEDAASQSVVSRPTDSGDTSSGAGDNFTIDSYNNLQYHTPADLLPFNTTFKYGITPGGIDTNANASSHNVQGDTHGEMTQMAVTTQPIDGLTIAASYYDFNEMGKTDARQTKEGGSLSANYSLGQFSVGYGETRHAPAQAVNVGGSCLLYTSDAADE